MKRLHPFTLGLAIFSMFFGAGNVIFPLAVGQSSTLHAPYAMLGLSLTAVIMPVCGLVAMILFKGDIRGFFARIGRYPGFLLALITIFLLGPLGSTPRCLTLSYSTLSDAFSAPSPYLFHAVACILIYILSVKRRKILEILGKFLTPALLLSLLLLIGLGIFLPSSSTSEAQFTKASAFTFGLAEGYKTMDLLAAFFFSSTIINILRRRQETEFKSIAYKASLIGALLLGMIYLGFGIIAAKHSPALHGVTEAFILSKLAAHLSGGMGAILVRCIVSLACLTTAIVLMTAFTEFVQKELLQNKLSYAKTLLLSLGLTYFMATLDYSGIASFLWPALQLFYPSLIVLTLLNIAHKSVGFPWVRVPFYFTFVVTIAVMYCS